MLKEQDRKSPTPILNFSDNVDKYQISEDEFVRQAGDASFVPFAVVKNGEWYERGNMGWWAIVTNEKKGRRLECYREKVIR